MRVVRALQSGVDRAFVVDRIPQPELHVGGLSEAVVGLSQVLGLLPFAHTLGLLPGERAFAALREVVRQLISVIQIGTSSPLATSVACTSR